jgi:hypothetical protein
MKQATRLSEPSSWAGIGLIATGIGSLLAHDYATGIPQLLTGLAALFQREWPYK